MAKKREEKEKIKKLKQQGLCIYEGEIIPVMEARKRGGAKGGAKGAPHGYKGGIHGVKGRDDGWKGGEHGSKGEKGKGGNFGYLGREYGEMGKEDGVKGKEFGVLGGDDGVLGGEFGKLCPKESQFLGQVTSMALHMEMASVKYDTPGEAPIQVNIQNGCNKFSEFMDY